MSLLWPLKPRLLLDANLSAPQDGNNDLYSAKYFLNSWLDKKQYNKNV